MAYVRPVVLATYRVADLMIEASLCTIYAVQDL